MFCPNCSSKLQDRYCPPCGVTYQLHGVGAKPGHVRKRCPKCNVGDKVLVGEESVGLLLPLVGMKSKMYRCTSCGFETPDKNLGSMLVMMITIKSKTLEMDEMRKK